MVTNGSSGAPPGPTVSLFGGPRVTIDGHSVALSPAQQALVAVVFAEREVVRLRVADILWDHGDETRVRHRLRQLLHQTNRKLGPVAIEALGDTLRADPGVSCDVVDFEGALTEGRFRDAAELVNAGFAARGFGAMGRQFEEWVEARGARYLDRLRRGAGEAWQACAADARWEGAREAAEALYALLPHDEEVVLGVIEARARVGRLGAAEAACSSYLERVSPEDGGHARITAMMDVLRTLSTTTASSAGELTPPFVGRAEPLAIGRAALARVQGNHFAFLLVTGEAGIGKTRTIEKLQAMAALDGFRCLHATAVELERRVPLSPLLDALAPLNLQPHLAALGEPWSSVVGATLPPGVYDNCIGEPPPIRESGLSRRLLDAFALLLQSISSEQKSVLFLDDLHWADATTVTALQFCQRRWTRGALGVVATLRSNLVASSEPVSKYLLGQEDLKVDRVELRDLSSQESAQLVRGLAPEAPEAVVERICVLAGPHPLYLTELTRDYLSGRFHPPVVPDDEITVPVSLQQIFRSRIACLSASALRVAGVLAVGARAMRLADISELVSSPLDRCIDSVEELEAQRLVDIRGDRVRISHELFRSALYNELSQTRRAVLHRAIAVHLRAEGREDSLGALATHFARAGDAAEAARLGWEAASRARDNGATVEAAHFYELVAGCENDPERQAEATAELARLLHLNRDLRRALPILELAVTRLRDRGRLKDARRLEVKRVEGLATLDVIPISDLIGRLNRIKREAYDHDDWQAIALALNAVLRLKNRSGELHDLNSIFGEMREVATKGAPEAGTICHSGLAMQAMFGDPAAGLESAEQAVSINADAPEDRLTALLRLLVVFQYQGQIFLPKVTPVLSEARRLAERSGDRWAQFGIENNFALAVLDAGEVDRARELMGAASKILGSADLDLPRFNLANNRAEVELARGDYRAAGQWYQRAASFVTANLPGYTRDLVNAGLGLCALECGDLSEARRRELAINEAPNPWFYDPTTILTFRARLLERRGDRVAAIALLDTHSCVLRGRLVFAWLKVSALIVALETKEGRGLDAHDRARNAQQVAAKLNLPLRVDQFAALAQRAAITA